MRISAEAIAGEGTTQASSASAPVIGIPPRSILAAGYVPLDIVSYRGNVWHAAGGTAGNVAALLGFLGWAASLVTDLGNDRAGRLARRDLVRANVSVDLVRLQRTVVTPRLVHEISANHHRYHFRCPSCGQLFPHSRPLRAERARELVRRRAAPDVFFFDRLNAGTLILAEHFSALGSLIVFEPSRPASEEKTRRAVASADLIKHADDRQVGLDHIAVPKRQVRVITSGSRGARFAIGGGPWHQSPAFSYPVVDAGGAGDWTMAGLIHALPLGGRRTLRSVGDALRWAQALAAVSCGAPGARGLAQRQSAEAVLQATEFLELHRDHLEISGVVPLGSRKSVSGTMCKWCLLPIAETPSLAATSV